MENNKFTYSNMEKGQYAMLASRGFDDDLFGELDLSSEAKDDEHYVWSIYGQCWLPK